MHVSSLPILVVPEKVLNKAREVSIFLERLLKSQFPYGPQVIDFSSLSRPGREGSGQKAKENIGTSLAFHVKMRLFQGQLYKKSGGRCLLKL